MGYVYAAAGRIDDARQVRDRITKLADEMYVSPYSLARIHIAVDEIDEAFECLERTFQERHGILSYIKVEPVFDRIRTDPRYTDLLRRMGLAVPS